jgi:hypothetical protein
VNALPVVNLGADTTTCANYGPIVLDAGAGFAGYAWNTNAHTQTVNAAISGTYIATVTGANGCEQSDAIVVTFDPCLGLTEQTIALKLFPNPTSGIVTIQSSGTEPLSVTVLAISGERLFTTNETVIDLSHLASGTYLVQVLQGTTRQFFRVEKTN